MRDKYILAVDDSRTNLQIIRGILEGTYTLMLAISGETALKYIDRRRPDLILLDLMMPGMSGRETYAEIRKKPGCGEIPVIFLTASRDEDLEVECLNMGATDFIAKPIVAEILERRIERALMPADIRKEMSGELKEKSAEIERLSLQAVGAIAQALEARDPMTRGHSLRVAECSRAIAEEMDFSPETVEQIYQTAMLHDVGKIGIPDSILKKEGRLTPEEYKSIKEHTTIGANILGAISSIGYLEDGARYHHERYDGNGYPRGLRGREIPVVGRIIAVADVFDALVSRRYYKTRMDREAARKEILSGAGTQFDPEIVSVFIRLLDIGKIPDYSGDGDPDPADADSGGRPGDQGSDRGRHERRQK